MLRYLYGDELNQFPTLRSSMFRDRAAQFSDRLGWEVTVAANGEERDVYDAINPIYVIWQCADGRHGGSMRFLPTVGRTMVNDHFTHLTDGVRIADPLIWECSRFCLSGDASPQVSAALMLGGLELGLRHYLSDSVGVFDTRMERVYRRLGWSPTILGSDGDGRDAISVGLWAFSADLRPSLLARAGATDAQSRGWLDQCLGGPAGLTPAAMGLTAGRPVECTPTVPA